MRLPTIMLLFALSVASDGSALMAQEGQVTGDRDGSSQQVEESDEAYRRRMELEDARRRNPTYTDPAVDYRKEQEKIDALPRESRENIRDQLVDIIVQNPDWKPEDALKEYPYEPTAAAQANPALEQQEQEAWDEQIEKFHAREAAAFGAYRGPAGGPGNPDGSEGDADGGAQGQAGGQQAGQAGSQSDDSTTGTYQPYTPQAGDLDDAESTEGVSESALEYLMRQQAGTTSGQPQTTPEATTDQESRQADAAGSPARQTPSQPSSESTETGEADEAEPEMRGIIAIEDLDKLEGTDPGGVLLVPPEEDEEEEQPNDGR